MNVDTITTICNMLYLLLNSGTSTSSSFIFPKNIKHTMLLDAVKMSAFDHRSNGSFIVANMLNNNLVNT